jgi:hypothetical protein
MLIKLILKGNAIMENLVSKVSYLKGLCDGLAIDESKPEGKLLVNVIDVLKDIADALDDVIDAHDELEEKVDEIDSDLADIEEIAYGDDDDDEDDDEDYDDFDDEDDLDDEEYEEGFDFGDEDSTIYEVVCACGSVINFDEETLEKGGIICPDCGETLEFVVDEDEEDDE